MRIFTLGRNGVPLFFFALLLFSGTYSSFGQEPCPTVEFTTQTFCDAEEAEVRDLQPQGDDVVWYRDEALTEVVPDTELLVDGRTYYAGNEPVNGSGTCTNPQGVTVVISTMPEILGVRATPVANDTKQSLSVIGICVADVNDPNVFVSDLRTDASPSEVNWYFGEDDETAVAVSPETELQEGTYWVERVVTKEDGSTCVTNRRRTQVQFSSEPAPEGPAEQEFCESENPTLSDIQATGENRYFATEDSETRLSANTPLEVGTTTYYVSTFGDQCESFERLAVTVTVNPATVTTETQEFCESIGSGNDFRGPQVQDLSPAGTWYADDTFTTPLADDTDLVDGNTYYMSNPETCEIFEVTADFFPTPNAGRTSSETFCQYDAAVNLVDYIDSSQLGAPDRTGTFSPALLSGDHTFDPQAYGPGEYRFTYTVEGNADCPTDSSEITVTVLDSPEAGDDWNEVICSSELEDQTSLLQRFNEQLAQRDYIEGYSTFSPDLPTLYQDYMGGDTTLETTYTVEDPETGCSDSATFQVTIEESPDAGTSTTIYLDERDDSVITLFDELGGTPDADGTWDSGDGTFDPTTGTTPATFTYTVTTENCSDSATVTIRATQMDCPEVTETEQAFCESFSNDEVEYKRPQVSDLVPADAVWYASEEATEPVDPDTFLEDGDVYYAGNADNTCDDRSSVTVDIFPTPNAGGTTRVTFCETDEAVNLVDYIEESILGAPQQTGSFSPALENNMFDPAAFGPGTHKFTYRVEGNEDCPTDESSVTVVVADTPEAGGVSEELCRTEDNLPTTEEFLAMFEDDTRDPNGTFEPSLDELETRFETEGFGTFSTTYTVTANNCTATGNYTVTINEEVPAEAGADVEVTLCSTEGVVDLNNYLSDDAVQGGSFSAPYTDGMFDPSEAGSEPIEVTYTLDEEEDCVTGTDSSVLTITVIPGPDAGDDGSLTINTTDEPVNLFDSLNGTPDTGGTWTPGEADGTLDPADLQPGTYTYTYTVTSDNDCEDTAVVTVTVEGDVVTCPEVTEPEQAFCESIDSGNNSRRPRVSDLLPANATWYATADAEEALPSDTVLEDGANYFAGNPNGTCEAREMVTVTLDDSPNAGSTTSVTFCQNGDPVDLLDVIRPSVLGDPDAGGTITPALASGTTIFDPAVDVAGNYTYRVESSNDVCAADTAEISISITSAPNAGEDVELTFCTTDEAQNLYDFLPEGVADTGTFSDLTDGMFDPSANEPGEYTFEYTVTAEGTCEGTNTSTYTITVEETPEAPTVVDFSDCVITGATVADLDITADGTVQIYSDEELTTPVEDTELLVEGVYYVTQSTEAGCESNAAPLNVVLNDSPTPSLNQGGNVFCEFDGATVADLENNLDAEGEITWYTSETGTETFSSADVLENGTVYYAALTSTDTGCESSERLPVTVTLEQCEIIIPEAFSPNGDGINDRFVIENIGAEYPNFTIEIYNRWGEPVYKGNSSTPSWDGVSTEGSLGDGVLPAGVYFYIVHYNDGQTAPTQGRLYLSR